MTEVIPGIHQLKLPIPDNPLEYTNTYLVQGNNGYLLIDAGWNSREALQSLKKQLSEIGGDFKDISQIAVTHIHPDHYGLAGKLRQLTQAKIALHYRDKELILSRNTDMRRLVRQTKKWLIINGVPLTELPMPQGGTPQRTRFKTLASPDIELHGGEIISTGIFSLQVIWTPGHSPGHICLYEPNRKILFSGDHILPVITPNVSLQPHLSKNPLGDFLHSLNVVKQLNVTLVLPAHEHHFTDLSTRAEEIIRHHQQRNSEILEALKPEARTAYEISADITWMPELGGVRFQNLAPWDKRMAVLEALAHLESMRAEAKVDKISHGDIIYYKRS